MEEDHRWEKRAAREEEAKHHKEEEHEEEEKEEGEEKGEEKPEEGDGEGSGEQASGKDNVDASAKKAEAVDSGNEDKAEPTGKGDTTSKQLGVSNEQSIPSSLEEMWLMGVAKAPRKTASSGPDEENLGEPTAKNTSTVDPSGTSDTKKKLDAKDDKKDEKKGEKKDDKKEKK
jgi:hypothetical protein